MKPCATSPSLSVKQITALRQALDDFFPPEGHGTHSTWCKEMLRALCDQAERGVSETAMPKKLSEMMVPMLDAISEPCKGCGKRPVDFISGGETPSATFKPTASGFDLKAVLEGANQLGLAQHDKHEFNYEQGDSESDEAYTRRVLRHCDRLEADLAVSEKVCREMEIINTEAFDRIKALEATRSATLPPTFTVLQLSKAIEYGVNCHSIDNAANMPDFMIASKIAATVHRRLAEIVTQREYVHSTSTKEKS